LPTQDAHRKPQAFRLVPRRVSPWAAALVLWLAAQAIQREFRLLTSNARDFADIPGLDMVVLKVP